MFKYPYSYKSELEVTAAGLIYAIIINPHSAELYNNLGVVSHKLKRDMDAVGCYERALSLKPKYSKRRMGEAKRNPSLFCHTRQRPVIPTPSTHQTRHARHVVISNGEVPLALRAALHLSYDSTQVT